MKLIFLILLVTIATFSVPLSTFSQPQTQSFEQIDSLQRLEKRNVVVFIYTDWCKYCHAMQTNTFKDDSIINSINENFWFTELNAEEKHDITFNGYTFNYQPTGNNTGIHELVEQLGTIDGKIAYPVLCILNSDYEIIFQYNQFLSPADLLKVLNEILKIQ